MVIPLRGETRSQQSYLFQIENLVLRARSEKLGYSVNKCRGMMEYWIVGILGLAE